MKKDSPKVPAERTMTLPKPLKMFSTEEPSCPTSNAAHAASICGKPVRESLQLRWRCSLSFEVLSGITIEQTRDLIEKMNDQIVGVVVTPK